MNKDDIKEYINNNKNLIEEGTSLEEINMLMDIIKKRIQTPQQLLVISELLEDKNLSEYLHKFYLNIFNKKFIQICNFLFNTSTQEEQQLLIKMGETHYSKLSVPADHMFIKKGKNKIDVDFILKKNPSVISEMKVLNVAKSYYHIFKEEIKFNQKTYGYDDLFFNSWIQNDKKTLKELDEFLIFFIQSKSSATVESSLKISTEFFIKLFDKVEIPQNINNIQFNEQFNKFKIIDLLSHKPESFEIIIDRLSQIMNNNNLDFENFILNQMLNKKEFDKENLTKELIYCLIYNVCMEQNYTKESICSKFLAENFNFLLQYLPKIKECFEKVTNKKNINAISDMFNLSINFLIEETIPIQEFKNIGLYLKNKGSEELFYEPISLSMNIPLTKQILKGNQSFQKIIEYYVLNENLNNNEDKHKIRKMKI